MDKQFITSNTPIQIEAQDLPMSFLKLCYKLVSDVLTFEIINSHSKEYLVSKSPCSLASLILLSFLH